MQLSLYGRVVSTRVVVGVRQGLTTFTCTRGWRLAAFNSLRRGCCCPQALGRVRLIVHARACAAWVGVRKGLTAFKSLCTCKEEVGVRTGLTKFMWHQPPAWHQHGTKAAPAWHQHGTSTPPAWHQHGTRTAPARSNAAPPWHQHGTSMAPTWHQDGRHGANTARARQRHRTSTGRRSTSLVPTRQRRQGVGG